MRRILALLALAGLPALADTAAVLPFWQTRVPGVAGDAAKRNLDWIGESVAETVRESLGSHGILTFDRKQRHEAFEQLGLRERIALSQASVMKVGYALDVEQVVYGSFQFSPDQNAEGPGVRGSLKVSARILDLRRLRVSPEFNETGSLEDLATIEAHLAWRALATLAPNAAPPESEFRTLRAPIRLDAEENYIRGLITPDPIQKEKFFLQAVRLDARFTAPCFQLGEIHYQRKEYREAAEWLDRVGSDDRNYREASFLLGLARFQSGDFVAAQKAFQTVATTVPIGEVINDLAACESRRNLPQAAEDFRKAADGDTNDSVYRFNLGYALWKKGDFAAAADNFRAVLDRNPDDSMATLLLGRCLKKEAFAAANPSDARLASLERLKTNFDERAYWQLKAMLAPKAP